MARQQDSRGSLVIAIELLSFELDVELPPWQRQGEGSRPSIL